jgi:hypothetical protein
MFVWPFVFSSNLPFPIMFPSSWLFPVTFSSSWPLALLPSSPSSLSADSWSHPSPQSSCMWLWIGCASSMSLSSACRLFILRLSTQIRCCFAHAPSTAAGAVWAKRAPHPGTPCRGWLALGLPQSIGNAHTSPQNPCRQWNALLQ